MPISSHSLPLSIEEPHQSRQRELTPRRRSPIRTSESWELTDFKRKSKIKERSGVKVKDFGLCNPKPFPPGDEV
jgi:hypothetical protein